MTRCPVCGKENSHLALTCAGCGAYIQAKVDNLDLFRTGWSVLESPSRAFHEIAIARHKNYIVVLSALLGIAYTFGIFWLIKAGEFAPSLINLLAAGLAVGPVAGVIIVLLLAWVVRILSTLLRTPLSYLNCVAILAYGQIPLVLSAILFLPIELLTFGIYFFTRNPSPYTLRPVSYVVLIGLDGLFALWAVLLCVTGIKLAMGSGWMRPAAIVLAAAGILGFLVRAGLGFIL